MREQLNAKKLSIMALLATISIWLALVSHYLSVPFVPMFKIDISDAPIFVSTILLGTSSGAIILFIVSLIRTFFFSVAGWPGFIMRMTTLIPILIIGICRKKNKNIILYSIIAITLSIAVKIPISYFFWTKFALMSKELIMSIIMPIIIPYNIIRISLNITLAFLFSKKIKKLIY